MRGKRSLGAVYTPIDVIDFMLSLICPPKTKTWKVLEPACADAPFLRRFRERFGKRHALYGIEYDEDVIERFNAQGARLTHTDFLLWEPGEQFDLILGNPPYGIIGDQSHYPIHALKDVKEKYKQKSGTWRGKYNIYGAFIEHSVKLLKAGGELLFIVPSSWLLLDDFKLLRAFLAQHGEMSVYYVGHAFPGVQVTAVVLHFAKRNSGKLRLYDREALWLEKETYEGGLIRFETDETRSFESATSTTIGDLFHVHFAARSPEVRKSPYMHDQPGKGRVPLLTGRNLKPNAIEYDKNYTGLWIEHKHASSLRSFYGFPHLVVGHTKGARVVAAYDDKCYPWREEFHLVPKFPIDESRILEYMNSAAMQSYVQTLYRNLIPHLTKTQLEALPVAEAVLP
ncbi:MAG: N-6 DNA methylase [Chlorobiales bacterium]|nr:N-6 DNA methylase [Chlorobiales bacterium]